MLFKKEIICTDSMMVFHNARDILKDNKIPYSYKVVNQLSPGIFDNRAGYVGSLGVNMDHAYLYYLYVAKKNYDKAQYLVRKAYESGRR